MLILGPEPILYEDLTNFLVSFMEENDLIQKLEYINIGGGFSLTKPLTDHKKNLNPIENIFKE